MKVVMPLNKESETDRLTHTRTHIYIYNYDYDLRQERSNSIKYLAVCTRKQSSIIIFPQEKIFGWHFTYPIFKWTWMKSDPPMFVNKLISDLLIKWEKYLKTLYMKKKEKKKNRDWRYRF